MHAFDPSPLFHSGISLVSSLLGYPVQFEDSEHDSEAPGEASTPIMQSLFSAGAFHPVSYYPEPGVCRICFDAESEEDANERLISPCACRGTMKYVHKSCLNAWRRHRKSGSTACCEYCLQPYQVKKNRWLGLLRHENLRRCLGIWVFLVLLQLLGKLVRAPFVDPKIHPVIEGLACFSTGAFIISIAGVIATSFDLQSVLRYNLIPNGSSAAAYTDGGKQQPKSTFNFVDALRAASLLGYQVPSLRMIQTLPVLLFIGFARGAATICDALDKRFEAMRMAAEDELTDAAF